MLPLIRPIIPRKYRHPFDNPDWFFEIKYDGFRSLLYHTPGGRSYFLSRKGKEMVRFKTLCTQIAELFSSREIIFDGEIIAPNEEARPIFADLFKGVRTPTYVAFDLLWIDGEDMRVRPFAERRDRLERLLPKSDFIAEAIGIPKRGEFLSELIREHDLEGIVAKRIHDPYRRGIMWYKILNPAYSQAIGRRGLIATNK